MKPSQQMTILGLFALVYYTVLLASGVVGTDVMPQFVVSAVIFLSSGQMMRRAARNRSQKERKGEKPSKEPDWTLRTQILRWVMAFLVIFTLGLWVIKPVGVSFLEMFGFK
jgi:Na+/H+ antiporter NhaC